MSYVPVPNPLAPTPSSYVFPNDGDALVVASVNSALQTLIDNSSFLRLQSRQVFNVKNYGAVGDGSADDTDAIIAAIHASTLVGVVYFPQGAYRVTRTLSPTDMFQPYFLLGEPGAGRVTGLLVDHSDVTLGFGTAGLVVSDVEIQSYGGSFANDSSVIVAGSVVLRRSSINRVGSSFTGQLVVSRSIDISECNLSFPRTGTADYAVGVVGGFLGVRDCTLYAAASGKPMFAYAGSASGYFQNNQVSCNYDTTNDPVAVSVNASGIPITGNTFRSPVAPADGVHQFVPITWSVSNLVLDIQGNSFVNVLTPFGGPHQYNPTATAAPAASQRSVVVGMDAFWASEAGGGAQVYYLPTGYRTVYARNTNTQFARGQANATRLPWPTHRGQRLTTVIANGSGANWNYSTIGPEWIPDPSNAFDFPPTPVVPDQSVMRMEWVALNSIFTPGDLRWVLVSQNISTDDI